MPSADRESRFLELLEKRKNGVDVFSCYRTHFCNLISAHVSSKWKASYRWLITDKLRSYPAASRTVMPSVVHVTDQYANNRAEVSHQPTRQRERQMRRFKSAVQLQRFASVHGVVQNLFRVGRHLLRAAHHRLLRTRAFVEWDAVTCGC